MRVETHLPRASSSPAIALSAAETANSPTPVRRSIRTWISRALALIGDGVAAYGENMYPSFFGPGEDAILLYLRETRQAGELRDHGWGGDMSRLQEMPADSEDNADSCRTRPDSPVPFAPDHDARGDEASGPGWGAWALSAPGRIWSALRRARDRRRARLRLESLDDATLKDIGIHRSQIAYFSWDKNRHL